jgi:hypothetical protein
MIVYVVLCHYGKTIRVECAAYDENVAHEFADNANERRIGTGEYYSVGPADIIDEVPNGSTSAS